MTLRFSAKDHEAFLSRLRENGTVRTHRMHDEPDVGTRVKVSLALPLRMTERQVLRACLNALQMHPRVGFAWRQNVGMVHDNARAVRFAFRGCSDILGAMKDGRFLAIECKATGKTPTDDQWAFLHRVRASGGVAIWVDDPSKLLQALENA